MSGWETSRHPEWDLMYAAGLTVREIAEHCHAPRSTVQRHFQVWEEREPGQRAAHEAALAVRLKHDAARLWLQQLQVAQDFIDTTRRHPLSDSRRHEQAIYQWLSQQRKAHLEGRLTASQMQALDWLGDWKTPPRQQVLDEQWKSRVRELVAFVDRTGECPRYRKFATEREHTLGVWLHIQTQRRARKQLLPWRERDLDDAVPGWHSRE